VLYVNSAMAELCGEQDDWNIPCSDDENYGVQGKVSEFLCIQFRYSELVLVFVLY
jgi:hypothetical protein